MWLLWAVAGSLAVVPLIGCGDEDDPARVSVDSEPTCPVGATRDAAGDAAGKRAVVLGCGAGPNGRQIEIRSFRDAAGPCIVIVGMPGGPRACGRAPSTRRPPAREPIGGPAIVHRTDRAAIELYGETTGPVRRVSVRYRVADARRRTPATLVRVRDRDALDAAGIDGAFGYFVATVPAGAREIVAVAKARDGRALGTIDFDPVVESMPPTVFMAGGRA